MLKRVPITKTEEGVAGGGAEQRLSPFRADTPPPAGRWVSLSPRDAHDSPPPLPTGLWELPSKEGQDKALPGQTLVFSISRPPPDHVK